MQQLDCHLVICYAGERSWFADTFPGVELLAQQGEDLGARMAASLTTLLQRSDQVVLIGSDTPDLPLRLVAQAFTTLQHQEVVVAPATDGGYVLIGEAQHHPQLFSAMAWSSGEVLAATRRRIAALGIAAAELSSWEDLDDFAALRRLLQRSPQSRTAGYLRHQLGHYF